MTRTVAQEIRRLGLALPDELADPSPLASLWSLPIDAAPPAALAAPPPDLLPASPSDEPPRRWSISEPLGVSPGIALRVFLIDAPSVPP